MCGNLHVLSVTLCVICTIYAPLSITSMCIHHFLFSIHHFSRSIRHFSCSIRHFGFFIRHTALYPPRHPQKSYNSDRLNCSFPFIPSSNTPYAFLNLPLSMGAAGAACRRRSANRWQRIRESFYLSALGLLVIDSLRGLFSKHPGPLIHSVGNAIFYRNSSLAGHLRILGISHP